MAYDYNDDGTPKKGDAAPLEGVVPREVMFALNLAFMGIGLNMLRGLNQTVGNRLADVQPILGNPRQAASTAPQMSAAKPSLPTPSIKL